MSVKARSAKEIGLSKKQKLIQAIPHLVEALRDKDEEVRSDAADLLSSLASRSSDLYRQIYNELVKSVGGPEKFTIVGENVLPDSADQEKIRLFINRISSSQTGQNREPRKKLNG